MFTIPFNFEISQLLILLLSGLAAVPFLAAIELLSGQVTAPDTTLTALTMASGNSLTIRHDPTGAEIRLLQAWVDKQTAGILRIRSPQLHDNVQGIRFQDVASDPEPLLPWVPFQPLISQDTLIVELSGSATSGDLETACLLIYYENLPGIAGRFMSPDEVESAAKQVLTVENTLSLGTGGGYTGEEALNAEFDLLKGNTDYAIIGYQVDAECAAIRYRGSDFGNLGIGGPGNADDKHLTANWFINLSTMHGLPLIPVFNSANVQSVLVDGVQDEDGADAAVNTILVELG